MRIALTITLTIALLLLVVSPRLNTQVVQTPSGSLEFIGLKSWSAQQLWDSIYARYPDEGAHACMAVLREEFGFQDALVILYPEGDSMRWVALVSEEGDPNNPFVLERPPTSHPLDSTWRNLHDLFAEWRFLPQVASSSYPHHLKGMDETAWSVVNSWGQNLIPLGYEAEIAGIDSNMVKRVWRFWDELRSTEGRDQLLDILSNEGNDTARYMAAQALISFHDDMSVRQKLVEAFRDPNQNVGGNAAQVLELWNKHFHEPVDWSSSIPTFRRVLGGEASSHIMTVMTLIMDSGDRTLGLKLLQDNTEFVLAMLGSQTSEISQRAYEFLNAVSGQDFGMEGEDWREWIQETSSSRAVR